MKQREHYPIRIYRELERNEQIIVFGDPAESQDFCAAVACSKKYNDFPIVFNAIMESSQFGYELYYMCKYIQNKTGHWPKLAVERNTGQATIYVLQQLNYPDLFRMVDFTSTNTAEKGKIGWVTTGQLSGGNVQGTRRKMLDDFALAIKQGMVKMYDEEQIKQLMSFIITKGRPQAKSGRHDDLVISCLTEDVEVLTSNGWKLIKDVEVGEKIPSLNLETNQVEEAVNLKTINEPFEGDMIHFKGKSIDFLVTPNHKMVAHLSKGANQYTNMQLVEAEKLIGKHFRLHKDAIWPETKKDKWIISGYKPSKYHSYRKDLEFNIDDFMLFTGLFLAEGWTNGNNKNGYKLGIAQTPKGKAYSMLPELLVKINGKYSQHGVNFYVYNSHIARYFDSWIPKYACNKRIPRELLSLHKSALMNLWRGLELGDGSGDKVYVTSSKGLCDDVIELMNRLGWSASYTIIDRVGQTMLYGTRIVRNKCYVIIVNREQIRPRMNHHHKNHVFWEYYKGRQVCLSLDKNNTMLVRRNGKMMWTGNSSGSWQVKELTPPLEFFDYDPEEFNKKREKWRFT